jgi:hypothetical protein
VRENLDFPKGCFNGLLIAAVGFLIITVAFYIGRGH